MSTRPAPNPTRTTAPYWELARRSKLVIQQCGYCHRYQFYPRPFCISCLSDKVEWVESNGTGAIYTFTVVHRAPNEYFSGKTPYVVAAVDLDEGVRLVTNIVNFSAQNVRCGARVRVVFEEITGEISLPQFLVDPTAA